MAACHPSTPNTKQRLAYVFRAYADPVSHVLSFQPFMRMVRDIQQHLGGSTEESSVYSTAAEVFRLSGINIESGAIERSQFISACLLEAEGKGFRGTRNLLRLRAVDPSATYNNGTAAHSSRGSLAPIDLEELTMSSPKARRLSIPDREAAIGSPGHVHIRRTAVYRLGSMPHSAATKQKINECLMEAPSPAVGVPNDFLEVVIDVLSKLLELDYDLPPKPDGSLPFTLMPPAELEMVIDYATVAFARVSWTRRRRKREILPAKICWWKSLGSLLVQYFFLHPTGGDALKRHGSGEGIWRYSWTVARSFELLQVSVVRGAMMFTRLFWKLTAK